MWAQQWRPATRPWNITYPLSGAALLGTTLNLTSADPEMDQRATQNENPRAFDSIGQETVDIEFSQHG